MKPKLETKDKTINGAVYKSVGLSKWISCEDCLKTIRRATFDAQHHDIKYPEINSGEGRIQLVKSGLNILNKATKL